jgi:hypothetical protein
VCVCVCEPLCRCEGVMVSVCLSVECGFVGVRVYKSAIAN